MNKPNSIDLSHLWTEGWLVVPQAFAQAGALATCAANLLTQYRPASIGRDQSAQRAAQVRSDKIVWVGEQPDAAVAEYLRFMEQIRHAVNERCFLGLFDFECHFARFDAGDFYTTHLDAFADKHNPKGNRKLSSVLYLNENWQAEFGGELVLYKPGTEQEITRVMPELGTLVLFFSEEFPHEVLAANCERFSLTGWFRTRPDTL